MIRKKKRKQRKITLKGFFTGILFIGCIIAAGAVINHLKHSSLRTDPSNFEENYGRSSELNRQIGRIDHVLYEALYKEKVQAKNIYFSEVTPLKARDFEWDFTEITVKIPDPDAASRLGNIIGSDLQELKPDVSVTGGEITDRDIVYNISTFRLHTHRIRLVYKKNQDESFRDLPKIAIVIDDIGNDKNIASSLINIGLPITLSVLPSSFYGEEIAEKASSRGFEVMLHLPMEPKNYPNVNPGPDALLVKMNEREIKTIITRDLKKIPGVSGVNNHMGSYFTEKEDKMTYVLREIKKKGLFYLDSRTTSSSVGFRLAGEMGIPSAQKSVFLDNDLSLKAVKYQMERLIGIARYSGEAIGIGHPHGVTVEVLRDYADLLKTEFKVVPVSDLVK